MHATPIACPSVRATEGPVAPGAHRRAGIRRIVGALSALVACGNGDDAASYAPKGTHCSPGIASEVPAAVVDGAASVAAPAPSPLALPQAVTSGGPVLDHATLVSVTFAGDPLADELEDFVASIGCSRYWTAATAEYGILQAVAGTPVRLARPAPASIDDSEIAAMTRELDGHAKGVPSSSGSTVYVFFVPEATTVTYMDAGASNWCKSVWGYHSESAGDGGPPIPFAVVGRCPQPGVIYPPDEVSWPVTFTASHEIIESVTDPFPFTNPAFLRTDANHPAWTIANRGELGDLCDGSSWVEFRDLPWAVQPIWSNRAASELRYPCVPNPGFPLAYAAADLDGAPDAGVPLGEDASATAIHVAPGQVATVPVRVFGQGGHFDVFAYDDSLATFAAPRLQVSLDRTSADAGDTLSLTISKANEASDGGLAPFLLVTKGGLPGETVYFWGVTSD